MASLGGSWTVAPVSMGPECLLCDSVPLVTPLLWPQASSVSAHTPQGPQLTTHARPLVTVPCLGSRAGGTEAGQGFKLSHPHGAKRWGYDDSGLATSLTPVYPDAGTSHASGGKASSVEQSLSRAGLPSCQTPHLSAPFSQPPSPPPPSPRHGLLASFIRQGLSVAICEMGLIIDLSGYSKTSRHIKLLALCLAPVTAQNMPTTSSEHSDCCARSSLFPSPLSPNLCPLLACGL